MKILVAGKTVNWNRTSAGIGTTKIVAALSAKHQVVCLCGEHAGQATNGHRAVSPWPPSVEVRLVKSLAHRGLIGSLEDSLSAVARLGPVGNYIARRSNAVAGHLSGYHLDSWSEVQQWRAAIRQQVQREKPDVVFVRGAGISFEPHIAMSGLKLNIPWIANYHDPFPLSLYPEPYRSRNVLLQSARQEALHRRILHRATALTFPSRRLADWVLQGDLERYRSKAFVIPQIAMDLPLSNGTPLAAPSSASKFSVIHTGSLIKHRDPSALLLGFMAFVDGTPEIRETSQLTMVGRLHQSYHSPESATHAAFRHPNITWIDRRVDYSEAIRMVKSATAAVVIEANGAESPFFPAKLADYLWLHKPVLALTPERSVVSEILRPDYPLLVEPDNSEGVRKALDLLWHAWRSGRLQELTPPREITEPLSAPKVVREFEEIVAWAASRLRQDLAPTA